ncbi:CocE/NonD family hydrolase [Hymenobacter agri]
MLIFQRSANGQPVSTARSYYVAVAGGVKLAVDVHFPDSYSNEKLPALCEFTRYWRASENPETGEPNQSLNKRDKFFLANNYILVKIDVRGTGASYGVRPGEYTPEEVADATYIVDWIVKQAWSDGVVGAYGGSYSGTTAELLCATKHKAVKAVSPCWSDFDIYESPIRPYGMIATGFIAQWSAFVKALDDNATNKLKRSVRRVDNKPDEAVAEHRNNPVVLASTTKARYKDSKLGKYSYMQCSPIGWKNEISASKVPMLVLTSWMDAGTAEGTLLRFNNFSNLQKVVLMPNSHGGVFNASPFIVADRTVAPNPAVSEQLQLQLDFFDQYLKGKPRGVEKWPAIKYYNFGEESFRESAVWPPTGQQRVRFFFQGSGKLNTSAPDKSGGTDKYTVNFSTTTSPTNRWATQMGKPILNLDRRNKADSLMLTYTTEAVEEDVQLSGTPSITLNLSSTHSEGAVFVYLEDIDENGRSRYLTEGGLLLEHRKLAKNKLFEGLPYHSFTQADASPMPVNKVQPVSFKLWPISVLVKKGHSIRIAIAGADKDTFDRVPAQATPTYTIYRDNANASFVELPVIK